MKQEKGSEGSHPRSENIRSYPEAKPAVELTLEGKRVGKNSPAREQHRGESNANLLRETDHPVFPPAHKAKAPTSNEHGRRRLRVSHDIATRWHVKHGAHSEQ